MYLRILSFALIFFGIQAVAQNINLKGKISNPSGGAVSGAIVTLMAENLSDTTGADGMYAIEKVTSSISPFKKSEVKAISIENGILAVELEKTSNLKMEVFDVNGILLKEKIIAKAASGLYNWNVSENAKGMNILVIRVSVSDQQSTFQYIQNSGEFSLKSSDNGASNKNGRAKAAAAAAVDSLKIVASGYGTKVVEVSAYDATVNVTLEVVDRWGGPGNPPAPSSGCGKPAGITNGKKTISSGGQNRSYIIDIPNNYDQDGPYRLFFTFHWIGSNSEAVQGQSYYWLKDRAQQANTPVIFVAPQALPGNPNGTWQTNNDIDHVFFDDLFAYVKENLCIDTTRVFTTGFSFGGMMTYSLSENHQNQIRAGVGIAPANYNIYVPPKAHEPMAWMQTTGMTDGTCPWVNNESQRRGAKFIALDHATDNNCTIPNDVPTRQNGQYLCYDFEGCDEGYPVKACTFAGGHTNQDGNPNWIPIESWDFFMQF